MKQSLFLAIMIVVFLPSILLADAERIFKENSRAVVVIVSYDSKGNPISQGSGFVVREDGAIVTNYHVISNASDIEIKAGNKLYKVKGLLYIDKENDVVMLKADAKGLLTVRLGDINKANVGENVYVISSPQGLENTISDGILSGIREIAPERKILQITAPVSEGSSGGPVFNKNGEVIGIATFIVKEAQNLNFAIPVNLIREKISSKKVTLLKDAGITDYKKTAEYWFILGYYYVIKGQYDRAIEGYTKAIALDPIMPQAYAIRGLTYVIKGQHDRAIEDYNKAIELDPNYAQAYWGRGLAYDSKGQHDKAIEDYNKAIELDPNYAQAYWGRGLAYVSKGQYDRAIEDYNKAIALNPDYADAYTSRGIAYADGGEYDRAIEDYSKAIALDPNDAIAYVRRGLAYYSFKGLIDSAIKDYNKAIALDPNNAIAYSSRGIAYSLKGNMGRAISDYQKACDLGLELACELLQKALENR